MEEPVHNLSTPSPTSPPHVQAGFASLWLRPFSPSCFPMVGSLRSPHPLLMPTSPLQAPFALVWLPSPAVPTSSADTQGPSRARVPWQCTGQRSTGLAVALGQGLRQGIVSKPEPVQSVAPCRAAAPSSPVLPPQGPGAAPHLPEGLQGGFGLPQHAQEVMGDTRPVLVFSWVGESRGGDTAVPGGAGSRAWFASSAAAPAAPSRWQPLHCTRSTEHSPGVVTGTPFCGAAPSSGCWWDESAPPRRPRGSRKAGSGALHATPRTQSQHGVGAGPPQVPGLCVHTVPAVSHSHKKTARLLFPVTPPLAHSC